MPFFRKERQDVASGLRTKKYWSPFAPGLIGKDTKAATRKKANTFIWICSSHFPCIAPLILCKKFPGRQSLPSPPQRLPSLVGEDTEVTTRKGDECHCGRPRSCQARLYWACLELSVVVDNSSVGVSKGSVEWDRYANGGNDSILLHISVHGVIRVYILITVKRPESK